MKQLFMWLFSGRKERERRYSGKVRETILHDMLLFVLLFALAILVCHLLSKIYDDNNQFSAPVFILVVSLIARYTQGYAYGIVGSALGVFCVNTLFTRPFGHFDMSLYGYPLTFAAMLLVSISISTLTTRIKKQEQLYAQAEVEKTRANLLRSVSHDLRTPLTSIIGSSSVLLEDGALSQAQRDELIREINKDARWLVRITENILSVTKFSGSQVHLNKDDEVMEEILSSAIVKFKRNHPDIRVTVQKPLEILLAPMDATLIEQVLLNLFDNALIHGKTTSEIQISMWKEAEILKLRIRDNGEGIAPEVFPHLFDGKASIFNPHSDDHRNMGIGLSVCQSIIHAHGGKIQAENNKEGGASFLIQLPASEENEYEQT